MGGCSNANAGTYGYKTGTFITKKKFSNLFITVNKVYMYIYDVLTVLFF